MNYAVYNRQSRGAGRGGGAREGTHTTLVVVVVVVGGGGACYDKGRRYVQTWAGGGGVLKGSSNTHLSSFCKKYSSI